MNRVPSIQVAVTALSILFASCFFACHITKEEERETFSFPNLADSLAGAETVHIILKRPSGDTIDILYSGPVGTSTEFLRLAAPDYRGDRAIIGIYGYASGFLVYKVEKVFDGESNRVESTTPYILPGTTMEILSPELEAKVGATLPLPQVRINPANLADKNLHWSTDRPDILEINSGSAKALSPGVADLRVRLQSDTSKHASIRILVTLEGGGEPVARLDLNPDTLRVAAQGAAKRFSVRIYPMDAPSEVVYGSQDTSIATISPEGWIRGVRTAFTRIFVRSRATPQVSDTAWVEVLAHVTVDSIRFNRRNYEIYQQGMGERITLLAHPDLADNDAVVTVRDPSIAKVTDGLLEGLLEGETWLVATSRQRAIIKDSARVLVFPKEPVDGVGLDKDTLRLYVNGDGQTLKAAVYPSALKPRFQWSSSRPAVANVDDSGRVLPKSPGFTYVSVKSRADTTKKDSALVIVKKDTPRLDVGNDTTVSRGAALSLTPTVIQEYGQIMQFKVDWNEDGRFEDSSTSVKPLTFQFVQAGSFRAAFYIRDSEGNDTTVHKYIKVVDGLVVQILSPRNGSYTNQNQVDVEWSVGPFIRSDKHPLTEGANTIARSAADSAGKVFTASITVYMDTKPPAKPEVKGPPDPIATRNPTWSWSSGGGGGSGTFRYKLNSLDMASATVTADTFLTSALPLPDSVHILHVQERDEAGNWSGTGSFSIRVDLTPPQPPQVKVTPSPFSSSPAPTWTWSGRGEGMGLFRYKLDSKDFRTGAKDTLGSAFTPATALTDGRHVLYVQERDSAGNWSALDSAAVTIDATKPEGPIVTVNVTSPTREMMPEWNWTTGPGGDGTFRYRLNNSDLEGIAPVRTTAFKPAANLPEGPHTFYLQERDLAGNWSATKSSRIRIDTTKPVSPTITLQPGTPTNDRRPTWSWSKNETGTSKFRFNLGNGLTRDTAIQSFRPASELPEGYHSFRVQECDSAGNCSDFSASTVRIDLSQPAPPAFTSSLRSPLNSFRPTWTWNPGSGGNGTFRYSLDGSAQVETTSRSFQPGADLSEGRHSLSVQERDSAGNWSQSVDAPVILARRGYMGSKGFTDGQATNMTVAVPDADSAIVAYTNESLTLNVRRFRQGSWTTLGSGLFTGVTYQSHMAIDAGGNPYVAYTDFAQASRLSVMALRNGTWQRVGPTHITTGGAGSPLIAVSPTAVVYVGYSDANISNAFTVSRFSGSFWEELSRVGLSSIGVSDAELAFDRNGDPLLAFSDYGDFKPTVVRYSFESRRWDTVGNIASLNKFADKVDLIVSESNQPYLAFPSKDDGRVLVYRLEGNTWVPLTTQGLPIATWSEVGISLDPDGAPIIAFQDETNISRGTVMTLRGASWVKYTAANLTEGKADWISLHSSKAGVPHIAYQDATANSGLSVVKVSFDP